MNSDGRMTMQFFHRTPNRNWISSSTVEGFTDPLPYSSIFFSPSTSDHSTSPIRTTSTASDLTILSLEHQDLINRHKSCLSQLQKTFREAETLRQENTNLRVANGDLENQLSHLVDDYLPNQLDSMMFTCGSSSSISTEIVTPPQPSITEQFGGLRVGEKITDFARRETGKSPTSVIESDRNERDVDRVTLPKSISVRSTGFLKVAGQVAPKGTTSSTSDGSSRSGHSIPVDAPQKVYVRGGNKKDGPIELEVHTQGMFKTELCNKWEEAGTCPYGEHCQFAHGFEELRPVLRHPRYKTEVCRMVLAGDPCPYGHRCHFRHALTEQEKLMLPFKLD